MLTFGHSLVELPALGDLELAESCRTAFLKYVTIVRRVPDSDVKRIADHKPSNLKPRDAKSWQSRDDHAVDELKRLAPEMFGLLEKLWEIEHSSLLCYRLELMWHSVPACVLAFDRLQAYPTSIRVT